MEFDNNRINFNNIKLFLDAVDLTNYDILLNFNNQNDFICHFLSTGDLRCLSKEGRKLLKQVNFQELIIDIEATLLLHDLIKNLLESDIVKMYKSDYWTLLYKDMPSTINGYDEFIERYKQNFNVIIDNELASANHIIYSFLSETLCYLNTLFNGSYNLKNKEAFNEYSKAMLIPKMLLEEKNKLKEVKMKRLFKTKKKI